MTAIFCFRGNALVTGECWQDYRVARPSQDGRSDVQIIPRLRAKWRSRRGLADLVAGAVNACGTTGIERLP